MSMPTPVAESAVTPTPSAPTSSGHAASASGAARSALRGRSIDAQLQLLTPRDGGAGRPTRAGARAQVGRGTATEAPTEAAAEPAAPIRFTAHSERPTPDGHQHNRGRFGVGEMVVFRATTAGDWNASTGSPSAAFETDELHWQAPETPGSCTVTFTANGQSVSMTVRVLAPERMSFTKGADLPPPGTVGAEMHCQITFAPLDVSFDAIQWLEEPGPQERDSGFWAGNRHPWPGNPSHSHVPNPTPTDVGPDNKLEGFHDRVMVSSSAPREEWEAGYFEYHVPNRYVVPGMSGARHPLPTTRQTHLMHGPDGTVTLHKEGATTTRAPRGG